VNAQFNLNAKNFFNRKVCEERKENAKGIRTFFAKILAPFAHSAVKNQLDPE
jgi:hypothetical protein